MTYLAKVGPQNFDGNIPILCFQEAQLNHTKGSFKAKKHNHESRHRFKRAQWLVAK